MQAIREIEQTYRKPALPSVQTGDTVRVHQLIKEGNKQRIQVFEGVVIRTHRMDEVTACITVRRIASGVGVEKTFLLHSPNVSKVEIMRRSRVRRNFLSYLRGRRGKSARLQELAFDKARANDVSAPVTDEAESEIEVAANQDALDDAVSVEEVAKDEIAQAGEVDEASVRADVDNSSEQEAAAEEYAEGVDRAEPRDEKAL